MLTRIDPDLNWPSAMTWSVLISSSQSWLCPPPRRNLVDWLTGPLEIPLYCFISRPECGVKQYQPGHKSSFPHLRDVMWTPKSGAGTQFDPRGSGFLCVCTHGCLSNLRWHHPPFITGGGVGPCHLLSSLSTRPQRREEEQRRGGRESRRQTGRHRYSLVKLKQYVRHCRLLPHQIWHMFLSSELFWSQQFVSATILQRASLWNASSLKRSRQEVCTISCLIVNLMKGGKKVLFVMWNPGCVVHSTSLLSSSIHICLCGRLNLVQTASGAEQPCLSLPSIFTNASQVLGTAGLTLISLKYLFHPSSEQIEQKHWRLFQASANALETSLRQKSSVRIHSLGL